MKTISGRIRRLDLDRWNFDIRSRDQNHACCLHPGLTNPKIPSGFLCFVKGFIKLAFLEETEIRVEADGADEEGLLQVSALLLPPHTGDDDE